MKTAIIIMSDPKSGSEEALGRVFNALALASGQWPLQCGSRCGARRLLRLCRGLRGHGKREILWCADCERPCAGRNRGAPEPSSVHRGRMEYGRVLSHSLPAVRRECPDRR